VYSTLLHSPPQNNEKLDKLPRSGVNLPVIAGFSVVEEKGASWRHREQKRAQKKADLTIGRLFVECAYWF
jgi:hypothetical protein